MAKGRKYTETAVKDPFDTNEKKIDELRKCRAAKLFVRPDFIDALLEEYDEQVVTINDMEMEAREESREGTYGA